jgi:hypothetical protein
MVTLSDEYVHHAITETRKVFAPLISKAADLVSSRRACSSVKSGPLVRAPVRFALEAIHRWCDESGDQDRLSRGNSLAMVSAMRSTGGVHSQALEDFA